MILLLVGVAAQRAVLVAVRTGNTVPMRRWRARLRDHRVEELQAVQAQRPLRQAFFDLVLHLEPRDHHGELALTVMRLGVDVPLEIKQHALGVD